MLISKHAHGEEGPPDMQILILYVLEGAGEEEEPPMGIGLRDHVSA